MDHTLLGKASPARVPLHPSSSLSHRALGFGGVRQGGGNRLPAPGNVAWSPAASHLYTSYLGPGGLLLSKNI